MIMLWADMHYLAQGRGGGGAKGKGVRGRGRFVHDSGTCLYVSRILSSISRPWLVSRKVIVSLSNPWTCAACT